MPDDIIVTMSDVRAAKMCSYGARAFAKRHDLDWPKFLKEGISSEELLNTGDHLMVELVEVARGRRR